MAEYDPQIFATWPDEQKALRNEVWFGLIDGDLDPLRRYLQSDYPLTVEMREEIAACITGDGTLHKIVCTKRKGAGRKPGARAIIARARRNQAIWKFVEEEKGAFGREAAVQAAADRFNRSRATIEEDLRKHRDGELNTSFSLRTWG